MQNLGYKSGSYAAITDSTGTFYCQPGGDIEFSIGELTIGSAPCAQVVTPVDLVEHGKTRNTTVMGIASFLQTLDADGSRTNGVITISADDITWVNKILTEHGMSLRILSSQKLSSLTTDEIAIFARDVVGKSRSDNVASNDLLYVLPTDAADRMETTLASLGIFIPQVQEAYLNQQVEQIGGATVAADYYSDAMGDWVLYSMANRFAVTRIGMINGAVTEIDNLPGTIRNITLVPGQPIALLSMGGKGIGVVDITNPAALVYRGTMSVNYATPEVDYSDGGGNHLVALAAEHTNGVIDDLLVYNDGTDDQLLIANQSFGIQKTKLSNLLNAAPGTAITVDGAQTWTLKYASENPWGGPVSLKMHDGKLYVALEFLGLGIYDPADLTRLTTYNLYADATTREDWFGYEHEKAVDVLSGEYIDADGMPTWQEASRELISNRERTTLDHYPWARFDRYGKYYYNAHRVDVVDLPGGTTMAYIAYGLGGLVAVDVTGTPTYAGYIPAPPAHGPDEPTGSSSQSIMSHHGAGALAETGVQDVHVVPDAVGTGYKAYFSDHFAGLVVVSGAENPAAHWHGVRGKGAYNNDSNSQAYWPDYEFVTSYDMTPVPVGDESMPKFLTDTDGNYDAPVLLATGEINGHGGAMFIMPNADFAAAGQVDLVQSAGAGGVSFIDITDLTTPGMAVAARFSVPVHLASTNETGGAPPGEPTEVAIGHSEGLTVMDNHLFLADGPHGMSVWRIADATGTPTDYLHLVANTLMDEYPLDGILPTPHAHGVLFGDDPTKAYVLSQSLGLRRVDVSGVASAEPGSPLLLTPSRSDFYEHSAEGSGGLGGIKSQDHAYGGIMVGKYAIVADGGNGLTVYDTSVPADSTTGAFIVANLGGTEKGKAPLGRASSVKLWTDPSSGKIYAVVAAAAYGVSVVDMTGLLGADIRPGMTLIKTFEPIKIELEEEEGIHVGNADGKSVDVQIVNNIAYISYDSFGIVAYQMSDLVIPLASYQPPGQAAGVCAGMDPTKLFTRKGGVDCRPVAIGQFNLNNEGPVYAALEGGAQSMTAQYFPANIPIDDGSGRTYQLDKPKVLLYVAYGDAGVIKLDWSDPAKPVLLQHQDTAGDAMATAIAHGRVYVADYDGGLVVFK